MPCYKDEKTGTWYCQFRYADFTGKRKQKRKRGFKTKREAQEWEREFHLQKAKSCDMTLASFVELYFDDREHHVRDTTMDTKRNIFDTKIVPLLGNRKMNEITALDIRDWQQRIKEMGEATGLPYSETYPLHHSRTVDRALQLCPDVLRPASQSVRCLWLHGFLRRRGNAYHHERPV